MQWVVPLSQAPYHVLGETNKQVHKVTKLIFNTRLLAFSLTHIHTVYMRESYICVSGWLDDVLIGTDVG